MTVEDSNTIIEENTNLSDIFHEVAVRKEYLFCKEVRVVESNVFTSIYYNMEGIFTNQQEIMIRTGKEIVEAYKLHREANKETMGFIDDNQNFKILQPNATAISTDQRKQNNGILCVSLSKPILHEMAKKAITEIIKPTKSILEHIINMSLRYDHYITDCNSFIYNNLKYRYYIGKHPIIKLN